MFSQNQKTSYSCDVFCNKKLRQQKTLTPVQEKAINLWLLGKTQKEIATVVGRSREVVNRWFNKDFNFMKALEEQKQQLMVQGLHSDQSVMQAIKLIETALERNGEIENIEMELAVNLVKIHVARNLVLKEE